MLENYFVIAAVFTAWAIGYLDGRKLTSLFKSRFHAFVLALAAGIFWPVTAALIIFK
jgi:hypothetical protein